MDRIDILGYHQSVKSLLKKSLPLRKMKFSYHQQIIFLFLGSIVWSALIANGNDSTSLSNSHHEENENYQALEVKGKNPIQLIRLRGFKAELHYARTKDGYYIHLARIVNPLVSPGAKLKRPVIFNHGLHETATIWLINSRNVRPKRYTGQCSAIPNDINALNGTLYLNGPMMLANEGYDVWLMSMRGTEYSLHHDNLTPLDAEFWDYSLDDFGLTDVPTVVDYVREKTGAPKVGYIGHSQATFSVFALLSTYPIYADYIEPVVAVAPVAYFDHITSIARITFLGALGTTGRDFNGPFPPNARVLRDTSTQICASEFWARPPLVCGLIELLISGRGAKDWLKGYYNHLPFQTSLKVLRHFGLLINNKKFQRYEYDRPKNIKVYGSPEAPAYMISRIKSKSLCLISTKSDALSPPGDVEHFKSQLKVKLYRDIFIDKDFNHFDLIIGDARESVFKPILEIFESFTCNSNLTHGANIIHNHSSNEIEGSTDEFVGQE